MWLRPCHPSLSEAMPEHQTTRKTPSYNVLQFRTATHPNCEIRIHQEHKYKLSTVHWRPERHQSKLNICFWLFRFQFGWTCSHTEYRHPTVQLKPVVNLWEPRRTTQKRISRIASTSTLLFFLHPLHDSGASSGQPILLGGTNLYVCRPVPQAIKKSWRRESNPQ